MTSTRNTARDASWWTTWWSLSVPAASAAAQAPMSSEQSLVEAHDHHPEPGQHHQDGADPTRHAHGEPNPQRHTGRDSSEGQRDEPGDHDRAAGESVAASALMPSRTCE